MESSMPLPEYDNPPLIEVVFGVQFKELKELKTPHVGAFWEKIGKTEYPKFEENLPLAHIIESYGEPQAKSPGVTVSALNAPPLPRFFFISEDQKRLIQLQKDRFLQNWRKRGEDDEYPRYGSLYPQFAKSWKLFRDFVGDQDLDKLQPDQYELTYVNHIKQGSGWTNEQDIEKVFPWFKCKIENNSSDKLENVSWRRIYKFPDNAGRLHVSMQQAFIIDKKTPVLVLNLTARGFVEGGLKDWFDMAHEQIVRIFTDLTGPSVQKTIWKRKK
ncbi:MAG: TIGR04255 family protein [Desulfobacteraceae bacterium]|nr:TIGR04255 family protein [Desulfobacteraceae bacterium]